MSCKGLATLLVSRARAAQLVKLEDDVEDDHHVIETVARLVRLESKATKIDTKTYNSRLAQELGMWGDDQDNPDQGKAGYPCFWKEGKQSSSQGRCHPDASPHRDRWDLS